MATYQATQTAGDAPSNVEDTMYDMVFIGSESKTITGGKFQKNPAGDPKLQWNFNLLDGDGNLIEFIDKEGEVVYVDGDPKLIEVNKLTGIGFNIKASTVPQELHLLKALLTKAEYAAFEDGEASPPDDVAAPEGLLGRKVQGEVFVKENGYPGVGKVVQPTGGQKAKNFLP